MDGGTLRVTLRAFFSEAPADVVAAYLFGSHARGTATERSDVDVGILYATDLPPSLDALPLDLESELERAVGLRVQTIVLNRAPVDLIHRVFRDGTLVLDRDRSHRVRFEVKKRNEFFDLQPGLERDRAPAAVSFAPVVSKLAVIETCVRELRTLARPAEIPNDTVQERFAEHTLQIAIQAASTWPRTSSRTSVWASRERIAR